MKTTLDDISPEALDNFSKLISCLAAGLPDLAPYSPDDLDELGELTDAEAKILGESILEAMEGLAPPPEHALTTIAAKLWLGLTRAKEELLELVENTVLEPTPLAELDRMLDQRIEITPAAGELLRTKAELEHLAAELEAERKLRLAGNNRRSEILEELSAAKAELEGANKRADVWERAANGLHPHTKGSKS